jgi:tubulin beta
MGSIVQIQAGQCGNQLGTKFWGDISDEHGIGPTGLYYGDSDVQLYGIDAYFSESTSGKYVPRAVLADLEPDVLNSVRGSLYGHLFRPDNFIFGQSGAGNSWAKGYYSEGPEILGPILEAIRKEAETCDRLQAFQLTHSLGGGTGSGLGALILDTLRTEYPGRILSTYSVFPSPRMSDIVVEPYNCMLSMHQLIEKADQVFWFDNEALYGLCTKSLKMAAPTYADVNHLVSLFMSGVTCSLRYPGQRNADLRKLAVNLIPFPRMHFFTCMLAPLTSRDSLPYCAQNVHDLIRQLYNMWNRANGMYDGEHNMCTCNPRRGVYLTASMAFRAQISSQEVEDQIMQLRARHSSYFIEWIPSSITTSLCDIPPRGLKMAGTFVGNTTALREPLDHIDRKFIRLYERRTFVQWYVNEGLEIGEFDQAHSNCTGLIQEYEMYETAPVEPFGESEDDEDMDEPAF